MREVKFLPKVEGCELSGYVKIKLLSYLERAKLVKELNIKDLQQVEGAVDIDKGLDLIEKIHALAKENTIEMDLVRIDDGLEFKSFDDLEYDIDGGKIIQEIAKSVIHGVRLSKK